MILIAICDDNKNVREDLRKLLIQYSFERKEDFKIFLFASSQEFCETLVEVEYQIVFLDVVMKGKDGIEVGKELRVRYPSSVTQLIYISAYSKYVTELFQNQPFYFLRKPLEKEMVRDVMKCWWKDFRNDSVLFWFQQGKERLAVPIHQILYFRQEKRRIYVVTKTGEEWFYAKWDIVQEQLKKYKFFFCHNSYFVHLKYVRGLTATNIRMENGEELSISRSRQKEVMEYISINKRY